MHPILLEMLSALAAFDDVLSAPLQRAELPYIVTWIYSYPACFFGIPGVIGGPLLALTGIAEAPFVWIAWVAVLIMYYVLMYMEVMTKVVLAVGPAEMAEATAQAWATLELSAVVPVLTHVLAYQMHPAAVPHLQYFSFSTLFTQIFIILAKRQSKRTRPVARVDLVPALPTRVVPLSSFVATSMYRDESFPSGDAAEAVVFAATIIRAGFPYILGFACVVMSATGRVFFHAHHVLDVIAGCAVAVAGCVIVDRHLPTEVAWYMPLCAVAVFFCFERLIRHFLSAKEAAAKEI